MRYLMSVFVFLMLFFACAATIYNQTKTTYSDKSFTYESLKEGGLAILPITAGQNLEGYRRPMADSIGYYAFKAFPKVRKVMHWRETMEILNDSNLVDLYQQMRVNYYETAVINRAIAQEIGEALDVRYALMISLQDFSEKKDVDYNFLTGVTVTRETNVQAHSIVIDLTSGDVVQEIIGKASSTATELEYTRGYETYASIVAKAILAELPGSKIQAPKTVY